MQTSAWEPLLDLAEEQWGLFTRRQAAATGMAWSTLARMAASANMIERVAHGVYRLRGAPPADHIELRAAWLQLAPGIPAWERAPDTGVVSHRSAAALYGLGHLPADSHQFTLPGRRQSRRTDVRLYRGHLKSNEHTVLRGLPVTRPARIAADLIASREDPGAIGHVIADALRGGDDDPDTVTKALAPHATRYGLRHHDGEVALLGWLLDLAVAPERERWLTEAVDARDGGEASS